MCDGTGTVVSCPVGLFCPIIFVGNLIERAWYLGYNILIEKFGRDSDGRTENQCDEDT